MNGAVYPSLGRRKVLVSGGASGIGAALVEGFARQGSQVAFLDIDEKAGRALAARIDGTTFLPCDLRDTTALMAAVKAAETTLAGSTSCSHQRRSDDGTRSTRSAGVTGTSASPPTCAHCSSPRRPCPGDARSGWWAIVNFGSISWHLG